jgi:hypothetical protein
MRKSIIATCIMILICLCSKATVFNVISNDDSVHLNVIFYGKVKNNERLYIKVQSQIQELKINNSSNLDSLTFMMSAQTQSSSIYVIRTYAIFKIKRTKRYAIIPYGVKGKYLVIQQSHKIKRKYRFGHYWLNDPTNLLRI